MDDNGGPDWIIEIVSLTSKHMDYYTKMSIYRTAGVREYWIEDAMRESITVYDMEHDAAPVIYHFADKVKVNIYTDLEIDFTETKKMADGNRRNLRASNTYGVFFFYQE